MYSTLVNKCLPADFDEYLYIEVEVVLQVEGKILLPFMLPNGSE